VEDHQRDIALFRYSLIREAADPELSPAERGALVRRLAAREHALADGSRVRVGRSTLDRWIRDYRTGGYHALVPQGRRGVPLTASHILDAAVVLKREEPRRTATHIADVLAECGWTVSARTLQRHFARLGLDHRPPTARRTFGRFEADERNQRWTGDAMHGRFLIGGRKPILFAFIDDHSRLIPGARWAFSEDTVRLEAALRAGLQARGVPEVVYVDNGSPFVSRQLERACAILGARLVHSRPGQPEGRGKIERFFRTVRDDFEIEATLAGIADLAELNQLFTAWLEQIYHRRVHSETGQAPLERFDTNNPPPTPSGEELGEAFLWSEHRKVTKTATVSLHGNVYEVDGALVGRRVELVFDPFDLTTVQVRLEGRPMGTGVPHRIGRHTHPQARADTPPPEPERSGIDYLRLVEARHADRVARRITYSGLVKSTEADQMPGQLQIPTTDEDNDQ
jgi:putative transposase